MTEKPSLYLDFHGRFIDALGIQMYQKPTAALAELIANAWDADASQVSIDLPDTLSSGAEITIRDNGHGMTLEECQQHYLKVGRNRRRAGAGASPGGRPVLGRKGIGKFAGFGIAKQIVVDTISGRTGERTVFLLDLEDLRSEDFIESDRHPIEVLDHEPPDEDRKDRHATLIRLRSLTVARAPKAESFIESMAKRFMLAANASSFAVSVNGVLMSDVDAASGVEFDFPAAYRQDERPEGLRIEGGEAVEKIGDDEVRWRIRFRKETIGDSEFRGVSVFCGIKVAQTPFFFDLSGGLSGQHGQQYMFGHVRADYLDHLTEDIITTERQRVNWESPDAAPLLEWGQNRIKALLSIWKERRGEERNRQLDDKIAPFSPRLERLQPGERKTVAAAIRKIASISTLDDSEFTELATAILTAWENGRLKDLIERIASLSEQDAGIIISVMGEAQILTVLQLAEVIKTKLDLVRGLRKRIEDRDLENAIRDYIAENPWLISPDLERYKKETSLRNLLKEIADSIRLEDNPDFSGRVDLLLANGDDLVLLEFMRPGITIDRDHIDRFTRYVDELRGRILANTAGPFRRLTGTIVADRLEKARPGNQQALRRLEESGMYAMDWSMLLSQAERQFQDYFAVMVERTPDDVRIRQLEPGAPADSERAESSPPTEPTAEAALQT